MRRLQALRQERARQIARQGQVRLGVEQAPASGQISLRTFPRNFPGRSGTDDDQVYLCSPETAAASALTGEITDPRDLPERLDIEYPTFELPQTNIVNTSMLEPPLPPDAARKEELVKGPNQSVPDWDNQQALTLFEQILVANDNDVDAVFAANDQMALGALGALWEKGLSCPQDVSLIGFDDQNVAPYTAPPLTTIRQPLEDLGRLAADRLVLEIRGDRVAGRPELPTLALVKRASVRRREV